MRVTFNKNQFGFINYIFLAIFKIFTISSVNSVYAIYSKTYALQTIEGYIIRIIVNLGGLIWIFRDLDLIFRINKDNKIQEVTK